MRKLILIDVKLEDRLETPDNSDFGDFVECDLLNPDIIQEKTKFFPFCTGNKCIDLDKFSY